MKDISSLECNELVGESKWIWVSVRQQKLRLIEKCRIIWEAPCSTSVKGVGERINSEQTPRGWHVIVEKIGEGAPIGQVFKGRKPVGIWEGRVKTDENLILTRILRLSGLEEGFNKGVDSEGNIVDSYQRYIYIHGTNKEEDIGKPTSRGCICLTNEDVIFLFENVEVGTKVLITED